MAAKKFWLVVVRYADGAANESGPFTDQGLIKELRGWLYALEDSDDTIAVEIRVLRKEGLPATTKQEWAS